jgi:hypothetical protein
MTYFINQCAYHPQVTDAMAEEFLNDCVDTFEHLTHLIYVKAVQPNEVERNGSRIANKYYQKAIDVQFAYWLGEISRRASEGPDVLIIDWWDLEQRKKEVLRFLEYQTA